jgi:hypothetical protein
MPAAKMPPDHGGGRPEGLQQAAGMCRITWHLKVLLDLTFDALPDLIGAHFRIFH